MYIITYPAGEAAWFEDLPEVLRHIEYDAFGFMDCNIYKINPDGVWLDAIHEIEPALRERDQEIAWDMAHEAWASSPGRTGRV
jgi:hypothetical protein